MSRAGRGCPFLLLMRIFVNLVVSVTSTGIRTFASVRFDPPYVHDLIAGTNSTVTMAVDLDTRHQEFAKLSSEKPFTVILKSIDEGIASASEKRKQFRVGEYSEQKAGLQIYQLNFTVTGHFLGKTAIETHLLGAGESFPDDDRYLYEIPEEEKAFHRNGLLDVWVIQDSKRLVNRLFLSALVVLIVIANVLMGCELDMKIVLETIRKPLAPVIGFGTQFIAMPLLAYGIANVVFTANGLHSFALGLFVAGCAPGGGASNYWTILLEGNLPVSITMTFVSTLAALVMMPFWMWLLGFHFLRSFYPGAQIKVPYVKIVSSLVTMIVPLCLGIAFSHFKPALRLKARKVIRPFMIFVLVFLIVFGTVANFYMIRLLTWTAVIGGLLLPWCGFSIGCFTAILLRQPPPNVTAIAIETGIQNTGIAIMLLKFSFPDPDADISALIPVISASMTPIPLLFVVALHWAWKVLKRRETRNKNHDPEAKAIKAVTTDDNQKDTIAVTSKIKGNEENPLMSHETKQTPL